MKAKELKYYKPLDITQLSGSPWNTAEKVLGLDQDDKVIMAEPEETVTPEYVDEAIAEATEDLPTKNWVVGHCDLAISAATADLASNEYVDDAIDQAMEVETARTEDVYAKKSEVPDLDDYYTKEEVDEAISGITVDLSDYYTKDETDQAISAATQDLANTDYVDDAIASETARTESTYLKQSDIEDDQFPTKNWVKGHTALAIEHSMEAETARTESTYAKKSEIPSLDGYATETYVDDAIAAIPQVDLSGYAKTTAVTQDIQSAIASETARTESTYAKPSDIPSLNGYATEQWVESQGYLTEHQDLSAYAKTTAVTQDIQTAIASETARTESTYLKEHQSLDNYYTKSQVDAEITGAIEGLASEQYVDDAIAAIPPVDLSAYAKTTAVTQDIQTAMAAETARTESTYLKEHQSLDNYYTKSEVDADFVSAATAVGQAIDAAVQGLASETYVDNAVAGLASEEYVDNAVAGIVFPDDYATTGDVANAVEGLASESYVNDAITSATEGMATQSDLEGLASEQYVDDAVNGVVQGIGMLGMVNDVSESNGTVTVQKTTMQEGQLVTGSTSFNIATPGDIQTAMASETARTESTYLKEHQSLDNYYTKSEVDAEITGATEDMATKTWVGQQGYLTQHQDLSAYAKTTAVTEDIATAMASETARTESTYAKPSQIPSLAGYATETYVDNAIASETARTESTYLKEHQDISGKLDKTDFNTYTGATETALAGKLDASAHTVDNAMSSASTNPVENRVLNAALNGVTATTELTITNTDSAWQFYCDSNSQYYHFKDTSISKYKAVYLGDLAVTGLSIFTLYMVDSNYNWKYMTPTERPTTSNVGTVRYYIGDNGGGVTFSKSRLDGTFEYYILFDTEEMYFVVYKTLPASITTISDHKANVSDVPVAQDKSDTKFFVYDDPGRSKGVVREVYLNYGYVINADSRVPEIRTHNTSWSGSNSDYDMRPIPGNEVVGGIKSAKDSVIINNAASALDGFTEQITLTLGNQSATDYAYLNWDNRYLYETDDPRYEVIPVSASTDANYTYFSNVSLSGTTYYIENPINTFYDYSLNGKYELNTLNNSYGALFIRSNISSQKYLIIDKELLTVELSETLAITRAKSIPQAISAATQGMVTSGDVATQIDTAMASETARTESTYAKPSQIPSLSGYATEQWVEGKGYLTGYTETDPTVPAWAKQANKPSYTASEVGAATQSDIDSAIAAETARTESTYAKPSQIPSLTGYATETWVQSQGYLTQHQDISGKLDKTDFNTYTGATQTILAGKADVGDIPTVPTNVSAFTNDAGYLTQHQSLAEYYTKTEIDGMIGDIESLLASI